ncbi:response regulator [Thalassolituus sp. LLYu03]|uniref:response regulator n=1 Tax=Thalassolituus sp. LLYu03 TaxID=3421656 RepID=UPI003D2A88FF
MTLHPQPVPLILIIDDVPANLDVMVDYMAREALEIRVATNGEEGLEIARSRRPDLILLDVMMPGMDGFAVARALKQDPHLRDIPLLFLTAKVEAQSIVAGLRLGADDYLCKPVSLPALRHRVMKQLGLEARCWA